MSWLYRYETKGIQSWILSSSLLRDLSGGSALVEALTQAASELAEKAGCKKEDILQSTSGSMTAIFRTQEALKQFASEWPMQVAFRTPGLQLVQAWVKQEDELEALFEELIPKRNQADVMDIEVNPWVLRAGRSGLPAVPNRIGSKARQTRLDALTMAKERALQGEHYKRDADVTGGRSWGDFEEQVERWPEGQVAVIHADGSGIGQALIKVGKEPDKLKAFSQALKEACQEATRKAVDSLGPEGQKLYARPVVLAGDDLTYIVRACQARKFAQTWLHAFEVATEQRAQQLGGEKFYGGAGIAIVSKGYPFAKAYEYCEALCKAAKDGLKKAGRKASVIAFKRVTTSLMNEKDLRKGSSAWILDGDGSLQKLDSLLAAVRDLPRGTLRTWLDHFMRDEERVHAMKDDGRAGATRGQERARASQLWARAQEVAPKAKWDQLTKALNALGADTNGVYRDREKLTEALAFPLDEADKSSGKTFATTPIGDVLTLRLVEKEAKPS